MRATILIVFFFALVELAVAKNFFPKSFEANLEQQNITVRKMGKRQEKSVRSVMKSDIEMKYMYPGNIVFDTKDELLYVCNSEKTWVYIPGLFGEKGELTVGDSSKYCYSKIFDALANGLKDNSLYTVSSQEKVSILTFSEKAQDRLKILKIELEFKNKITSDVSVGDLYSMNLYRKNQKRPTKFIFKSFNAETKLSEKDFIFIPPKNTNIKNI